MVVPCCPTTPNKHLVCPVIFVADEAVPAQGVWQRLMRNSQIRRRLKVGHSVACLVTFWMALGSAVSGCREYSRLLRIKGSVFHCLCGK